MENGLDTIGERIKFLRESLRYNRREFCEKHNISESTLKKWENVHNDISKNALNIVIATFDKEGLSVNQKWLVEGEGDSPLVDYRNLSEKKTYPHTLVDLKELDDEPMMLEDQNHFLKKYKNSVSTVINSFEMLPMLSPGDYVGGIKRVGQDIAETLGRDCIVKIKNKNTLIVRRLSEGGESGLYCLSVMNNVSKFKDAVMAGIEIEFSAPIIWIRKKN